MNKRDVKNIEDLEEYYNKCRKIKFSNEATNSFKKMSLNRVYKLLILYKYKTLTVTGKHQCSQGRMRSVDDYIKICKYYFPKKSVKAILKYVKEKSIRDSKTTRDIIYITYCDDIRKLNFWRNSNGYYRESSIVQRGFKRNMAQSGFPNLNLTLNEIIES